MDQLQHQVQDALRRQAFLSIHAPLGTGGADRPGAAPGGSAGSGTTGLAASPVTPEIPEVKLIKAPRFGDARGFFSETYSARALAALGIDLEFVQDNHSFSARPGTIRGLHYQSPPFAQDKLVRVTRGAIFDVAVDIRCGSPTFGKAAGAVISAAEWNQLLIPAGFAHGFCTLEPDTEVLYKVTNYYAPAHDHGIAWDDPALGVAWPVAHDAAILSDKDRCFPRLADAALCFLYI